MVAVLLQMLAPVLSIRAAANVLAAQEWPICRVHDVGQSPQGAPHHQNGLCPVCQFCSAAPLFVAPAPPCVAVARDSIFVAHAAEFYVLARGPPQARPNSRAPPAIS